MEFLINAIFWIFAIYGLIEIIKEITRICTYSSYKSKGIYLLVAVKDQEEEIEMFLRSSLFRIFYGKEQCFDNILIADLDSKDNTREIATRIAAEYDQIRVVDWKECKDFIERLD